jgi:hypothetical protein
MAQIERRIQKLEQNSGAGSAIAMIFLEVPADMSEDDRLEASEELANAHGVRVGTVLCVTQTGDGPPPPPSFHTADEVTALFERVG